MSITQGLLLNMMGNTVITNLLNALPIRSNKKFNILHEQNRLKKSCYNDL